MLVKGATDMSFTDSLVLSLHSYITTQWPFKFSSMVGNSIVHWTNLCLQGICGWWCTKFILFWYLWYQNVFTYANYSKGYLDQTMQITLIHLHNHRKLWCMKHRLNQQYVAEQDTGKYDYNISWHYDMDILLLVWPIVRGILWTQVVFLTKGQCY